MKRRVIRGFFLAGAMALLTYLLVPSFAPTVLGWIFPDVVFRIPGNERVVYVTIDDAPSDATPRILAVLSKHQVPATFFVIGSRVHEDRQLESIRAAGFALGHHMWTTKACNRLTAEEFRSGFDATARVLNRYAPSFFRPPSGLGTHEQMV